MNRNWVIYLALICTIIFWGFSFIGTKIVLTSISPFPYMFFRFSIASLFFIILIFFRGLPKISGKDHFKILLLSFFEPGLYFVFETLGLEKTSASKTSIIIGMVPITVLIFARFFLKEKITSKKVLGIVLSIVGIIVLVIKDPKLSEGSLLGDLLILGAVITAALYIVTARNVGQKVSAIEITSLQVIYGSLFFAPFFLYELPTINWLQITQQSIMAVILLAVFATIGGFLLYNYALTKIQASQAAIYLNGIPVITVIFAGPILNEQLSLLQLVGGAIVLLAVYITSAPDTPKMTLDKKDILSTKESY